MECEDGGQTFLLSTVAYLITSLQLVLCSFRA